MSFAILPSPLCFREHSIDHGHIYKLASTLCRFFILQETVRRWRRTFSNGLGIVTSNSTLHKWEILVIVPKDAIRNTNQTLIFKDNLQPAQMAEEIQSAQRAEKLKKWAYLVIQKFKIEFSFELIKGKNDFIINFYSQLKTIFRSIHALISPLPQ